MSDSSTVENTAEMSEAEVLQLMMHDMVRKKFKLEQPDSEKKENNDAMKRQGH